MMKKTYTKHMKSFTPGDHDESDYLRVSNWQNIGLVLKMVPRFHKHAPVPALSLAFFQAGIRGRIYCYDSCMNDIIDV